MAFGSVLGTETWRVLSMKTPASGTIAISNGDAVKVAGNFSVDNAFSAEDTVLGEAMTSSSSNDDLISVKVSGVSLFKFTGTVPVVDGAAGVLASATDGQVKKPASGNGVGRNLLPSEAKGIPGRIFPVLVQDFQ